MEVPVESTNWNLVSGDFVSNDLGMTAGPRNHSSRRSDPSPVNDIVVESLENQDRVLRELYSCVEVSPRGHGTTQFDVQSHTIANSSAFQEDDKLPGSVNSATDFAMGAPFPVCDDWDDFLDMSGFFQDDNESFKEQENHGSFSELLAEVGDQPPASTAMDKGKGEEPTEGSPETAIEDPIESDTFCESVAMGIPYYVACQWRQMQQTQQQQQQAVMMLWSQACLSGACNMIGPSALAPSSHLGWSLPQGINFTTGPHPASAGEAGLFHQMSVEPQMRKRKLQEVDVHGDVEVRKHGRRPRKDNRVCKTCGTSVTPFWRKDKEDGRPLCNACGLYLAKNKAHRPRVLWKDNEKSTIVIN